MRNYELECRLDWIRQSIEELESEKTQTETKKPDELRQKTRKKAAIHALRTEILDLADTLLHLL